MNDPGVRADMKALPAHRDRPQTEVAVLDALADRQTEGMTVLELRSHVDADIDRLEEALADLKRDDLIHVDEADQRTVIVPDEDVIGSEEDTSDNGFVDTIRGLFTL